MRYRFARIEDFTRCIDLIHNSLTDRPDLRQRLPEIWSSLFRAGSLLSAVIEEVSLPEAERLLAIYLAVFVTDNYVEELLASPRRARAWWCGCTNASSPATRRCLRPSRSARPIPGAGSTA